MSNNEKTQSNQGQANPQSQPPPPRQNSSQSSATKSNDKIGGSQSKVAVKIVDVPPPPKQNSSQVRVTETDNRGKK